MAAQPIPQVEDGQQLALHQRWVQRVRRRNVAEAQPARVAMCAGCRNNEARYGFRDATDPSLDRPRTLCFECFRVELARREAVKARLARSWNAEQVSLPLEETLKELTHRRRRAQIAARHALGV
jgi:hypothetical protein